MEQLRRGTSERVDGEIACQNHRNGVEDGAIDIFRSREDDFVQLVALSLSQREFAVDVLHHHDRAVDDDAEIDCTDGEQIGGAIVGMQGDEGKQKGKRNGERDNDGCAKTDQEENQNDQHQDHAAEEVAFHRICGERDQFTPVVKRVDFDVLRKDVAIQFIGLSFHALENVLRLLAAEHENHALNRIVVLLISELPEPRRIANHDIANVLDANRHAIAAADDDVPDVAGVAHQSDAAHIIKLSALRVESTARIGIIGAQRRHHLRNRQVISINPRGIEQHLVLHGGAAETRIVGNTGNGAVRAFDHPIFDSLQFLRTAIGTFQHVAIDQAAGTKQRSHRRGHARGQGGLGYALEDDLPREIVVRTFFERQAHIGETVQRDGPHYRHVRNAVHLQFDGQRDQAFDFLGSVTRPLRDEFDLRRREVGVSVHRHAPERDDSGDHHEAGQHQHQKALTKRRLYDAMDHAGVDAMVIKYVSTCGCELLTLQRVRKLQEQAAISDNAIAGVQSGLNLGLSFNAVAECDGAPAKLVASRLGVNERLERSLGLQRLTGTDLNLRQQAPRDRRVRESLDR